MALVRREDHGAVVRLVMDSPGNLNALSDEMLAALQAAFDGVAAQADVKAVVLAGAGRAFCAGHDLRQMRAARASVDGGADGGAADLSDLFARCSALMMSIQALPQPVIAEVQGLAAAAGCQLAATCDMVVAAQDATFGVNGVNIGLFCSTPMVALSRVVPRKRAFEMLVTGRFASAEEALAMGLINRAVPAADLQAEAMDLAQVVAGKLGAAVRIGKSAFYAQAELGVAEAYALTGEVMVRNMALEETAEGIAAFLEKRSPEWS